MVRFSRHCDCCNDEIRIEVNSLTILGHMLAGDVTLMDSTPSFVKEALDNLMEEHKTACH